MKKAIISLIVIVLIILAGLILKDITIPTSNAVSTDNGERFVVIEKRDWLYYVVYDKETKVQYTISIGSYNQGTFTLLVDKDGKPLLYKGE